jgi:hypothetical protein
MAEFLQLDTIVVRGLWAENSYKVELPGTLVDDMSREINWALGTGVLPKDARAFRPDSVISTDVLRAVKPDRVEIVPR